MNSGIGLTTKLASGFLKVVRIYTYNTPIRKGSSRLMQLALKIVRHPPEDLVARTRDGRGFAVDLTTGMQGTVFFFGEYEPFITELVELLIMQGDVCIDAGANFGWYTTLMANITGPLGSVHAFEPFPDSFEALQRNTNLLKDRASVELNRLALSDSESVASITLFPGLPTGHASLIANGLSGKSVPCETARLDLYLEQRSIDKIGFLKVDVEGAELSLLKGATKIFSQSVPPIIVMEMALATSSPFGYVPNDLIEFIRSQADFNFYKIDEINRRLIRISGFARDDIGANVLCVPANAEEHSRHVVSKYLG
ncbi:MAG: FkbM family methyltransferase [Pyrinomonadaceae bacterium]